MLRLSLNALLVLICGLMVATTALAGSDSPATNEIVISVADQKLLLVKDGAPVATYPISTSRFGVGDSRNSYRTPLGLLQIASKIGQNAALGAVFKARRFTGEILRPNTAGRDPIVTRILWLRGTERQNANAQDRGIYIHGTPVEGKLGTPASYGCIRMRSTDVVQVFDAVQVGAPVRITQEPLKRATFVMPRAGLTALQSS